MGKRRAYSECTWALYTSDFKDHEDYDPLVDWNAESGVGVPDITTGDIVHKRNFVADVSFFNNKVADFNEDVEATYEWYLQRYSHLTSKDLGVLKRCLNKQRKDVLAKVASSKARSSVREQSIKDAPITDTDYELD